MGLKFLSPLAPRYLTDDPLTGPPGHVNLSTPSIPNWCLAFLSVPPASDRYFHFPVFESQDTASMHRTGQSKVVPNFSFHDRPLAYLFSMTVLARHHQ